MFSVYKLFRFLARDFDIPAIRDDYVVSTVHCSPKPISSSASNEGGVGWGWLPTWFIIDGFMFTHEDDGYSLCKFTEDTVWGIHFVPHSSVGEGCLQTVTFNC